VAEIRVASSAGFCFGVRRAVDLAVQALVDFGNPVYTLGPIIHNPQEVNRLREKGLLMAESLIEIESGTVVIRSHGAPRGIIETAARRGLGVVDATCPLVKRLEEKVRELGETGLQVIIVGESDHPEVKAALSYAAGRCLVWRGPEDIDPGQMEPSVGIVAQTTQSLENLQLVVSGCVPFCREVHVFNTVCEATRKRVAEALALAREVDLMIVVGGKNSGNTKRLAEAVRRTGTPTCHIESSRELREVSIPKGASVGVTAGASTPSWVIQDVVAVLESV